MHDEVFLQEIEPEGRELNAYDDLRLHAAFSPALSSAASTASISGYSLSKARPEFLNFSYDAPIVCEIAVDRMGCSPKLSSVAAASFISVTRRAPCCWVRPM